MSKMLYFSQALGASPSPGFLTFSVGDLKLRNLAKLCFFKLIPMKYNFKKSVITSFQCHPHN